MADELQISLELDYKSATDGTGLNVNQKEPKGRLKIDVGTARAASGVQAIGTTAEALDMQDVSTAGYAYFKNLDDTNFVEIGRTDGGTFRASMKLKPGEAQLVRLGTNSPTAKADTAAIDLHYIILSD